MIRQSVIVFSKLVMQALVFIMFHTAASEGPLTTSTVALKVG